MINILGKRYVFFGFSLLIIISGLIVMAIWGLPMAIDFTGGTMLEVKLESGIIPSTADVTKLYNELKISEPKIQTTSQNTLLVRSSALDDNQRSKIVDLMATRFNTKVTVVRLDTVGPTIGQEVTSRAFLVVTAAAIAVILYIVFAFRNIPHAFRYGVSAIIATIHDVLILIAVAAIGGKFLGWQVDSLYLTALLTVIGFSTQDTIVVFDRIRENSTIYRKLNFETMVNHSIVQTLQRCINTQMVTSEFLMLALALFGGITLREFAIVLFIGLASGSYSSIFIAPPILVVWENKEWRTWFKKTNPRTA